MMKNNVSALLLSMALLVPAGNAHVEPVLLTEPVSTEDTLVDTKIDTTAQPKEISPVIMQMCTHLAQMMNASMHDAIEAGSDSYGSFNYEMFAQSQATQFQASQQQIVAYMISLDINPAENEQVMLFAQFLITQMTLFLQNNTTLALDLMEATTKQAALAVIAPFSLFVLGLPEQFAVLATGKIQKPADVPAAAVTVNEDNVDYSTAAFRERVASLITQVLDVIEDIVFDEIKNCTNKDGMFDGRLYAEHAGMLMQKICESEKIQALTNQVPQGDSHHVMMFLAQRYAQAGMQFRVKNPGFETKIVAAKTEAEAIALYTQLFEYCDQAKKQYLDETFSSSEEVPSDDEADTDSADNAITA